jgi:hypothetical protein
MSELNEQAQWTLSRALQLLSGASMTVTGEGAMQVADSMKDLYTLYQGIEDNTIQLISLEQEAGPDPEESTDVAD